MDYGIFRGTGCRAMGLLAMAILCMVLWACSSASFLCSVPEAEGSAVCALSEKLHTTPEIISQSLQVANLGALEADLYTARQANEFIDKIIADIEDIKAMGKKISYLQAINYIDSKFKVLPARVKAVFVIMNPAGLAGQSISQPLTDYDFELLTKHLKIQKDIIGVYL
jgi:hypothetical protein